MTVSSLWKALNRGECGTLVGEHELASGKTKADLPRIDPLTRAAASSSTTPYNNSKTQTLAVDLSIWICESLTSVGMAQQHANPALYLVFSRTMRLLNLGIKLVFVVEGKSRVRTDVGDDDRFRKRRSGTAFWKACQDCQQMLELLGLPVVLAKAEGEALCALLSQRGIVDGVISNDGDCLLFGAKVIYTKFSIENLDNGCVVRYDLDNLWAIAENSDDSDEDAANTPATDDRVLLSRQDLISFALLTGSDLAGSGLAKVGHKKAIRFIRKCKVDNPLSPENAALGEMQAWARAATANCVSAHKPEEDKDDAKKKEGTCCSRCCHGGSKRNHLKHGCELCGTQPGEPCFKVTADDRFRKSLRSKALAMVPKFEPSKILNTYMAPNENQIPFQFANVSTENVHISAPQLRGLLQMDLIVKGRDRATSREYLQHAVGRLLSRAELLQTNDGGSLPQGPFQRLPRDRPVPKEIQKSLVQKGVPCFEVLWRVNATVTDENGEGMDGYDYSTVETRDIIEQRYPQLIVAFQEAEKERKKQGDGEKLRRQEFLGSFLFGQAQQTDNSGRELPAKRKAAHVKAREGFFQNKQPQWHQDAEEPERRLNARASEDITHMLRFVSKPVSKSLVHRFTSDELSSMGTSSPWMQEHAENIPKPTKRSRFLDMAQAYGLPSLTPTKELFCTMGGLLMPLTPINSNQGAFPPRHIFLHQK